MMPTFVEYTLAPALRDLVRSAWSVSYTAATSDPLPGVIAPDAHVEFVFQTGSPCAVLAAGAAEARPSPRAMIFALRRGVLRLRPTGDNTIFAFRVPAAVASVILGRSLNDCWDRPVALSALIGPAADEFVDRIAATPIPALGALLESWLTARLTDWGAEQARHLRLQNALFWRFVREPVSALADDIGVTMRTLRRHCEKYSGLSPKQLSMSGRILRACVSLRYEREVPIVEVSHGMGFNDQAAFTNAFRHYVGMTPAQFRAEPIVYCEGSRG